MPSLRIKKQVSIVSENGTEVSLPENTTTHNFGKGEMEVGIVIDNTVADTMVTPISVSLVGFPNTTAFHISGEYIDNDLANGIETGDRAKIQVRFDGGNWIEAYSILLEGYKPANTSFDLRASGTRKIRVKRTISAN